MAKRFRVIDADGHCIEHDEQIAQYATYLGKSLKNADRSCFSYFPSLDGWFRAASDRIALGDPESWVSFLADTGMEMTFLYPTGGLAFGLVQDRDWSIGLARAYNDWLYNAYTKRDGRLQGIALLPILDVGAAVTELRHAVRDLGMRGALLPAATVLGKAFGHRDFDPLYEEAERLDVALAFHGAPSRGFGFDFFDSFIKTHTLEHPFAILVQFTSLMFDGVFERFPQLRVAFLECGAGWVPYMMDRMDDEFEKRGQRWCPFLRRKPSEYVREGNIYFSCEVEERTLPYVIELVFRIVNQVNICHGILREGIHGQSDSADRGQRARSA